ncbi:MAG: IS66 family insertion sequence element accessory protein TnpB, partial [Verrucomicrobiota bacterium]
IDRLPQSGHLFGFSNKRRNMAKFLYWDNSGFWVSGKRLQRGTFWWPSSLDQSDTIEIWPEQLTALLSGLSVVDQPQRPNWQRIRPAA